MLDVKFIKENVDMVKQNIIKRNMVCDIDQLLELHNKIAEVQQAIESLNAESNANNKAVQKAKTSAERAELIERGKKAKEDLPKLKEQLEALLPEFNEIMLTVPNIMAEDTPVGKNEELNVEVESFLAPTKFDFQPRNHIELGEISDLFDFEAGAKVAGTKFYYLKNEAVMLDLALQMYIIQKLVKKGYTPLVTPDLAKSSILQGSGFNPRGNESNIYNIEGTDLSLIATAEITIGGMLSDTVLNISELPKKYVAFSHCFRTEAGGGGRAGYGLYRVHQFSKVEMYQFVCNEDGEKALQEMLGVEKEIFSDLGIPYRVVRICSGDMGAPAYKKYDIEAWMPGKGENGEYGEVTSVGNFTNFQSRRLNIKYIDENGKRQFVTTLNGTASATGRTMLAILENFQDKNGNVKIPKVLIPFTGFDVIKPKTDSILT